MHYTFCSKLPPQKNMKYGQFCPIAKATEIIGERWTILILRELLLGTARFSDFQRALSLISPTLLTKRLNQLVDEGLVIRKAAPTGKRTEYFLTAAGRELGPIINGLGEWGMRWARDQMNDDELDVELLMHDMCRQLDPNKLPGGETVIHFSFCELEKFPQWWIVTGDGKPELCVNHPGKEAHVHISADVRTMIEIYSGDLSMRIAKRESRIQVTGERVLTRTVESWMPLMALAHIRPQPRIDAEGHP